MSFGRRGVEAGPGARRAAEWRARPTETAPAVGGFGEALELKRGARDIILGAAGVLFFGWLLQPLLAGGGLTIKSMVVSAAAAICLLGCAGLSLLAATRRTKLKVDANGLYQDSLFGTRFIAWEELAGFEILTVNMNKTVFAKARKGAARSTAKKIAVPVGVFKSRDYVFLEWTKGYRPDLAGDVLAVMEKVGAKRLVRRLMENGGIASA